MTAHQLAQKLLEGPDLFIGLASRFEDDEGLKEPVVIPVEAENPDTGECMEALLISYKP